MEEQNIWHSNLAVQTGEVRDKVFEFKECQIEESETVQEDKTKEPNDQAPGSDQVEEHETIGSGQLANQSMEELDNIIIQLTTDLAVTFFRAKASGHFVA